MRRGRGGADGHLSATPTVVGVPHRPFAAVAQSLTLGHQADPLEERVAFRATFDAGAAVRTRAREPRRARHERRGAETTRRGTPAGRERRVRFQSRQRRRPLARALWRGGNLSHRSGAASRPYAVRPTRPEPQGRRGDVRRRQRERHGHCTRPRASTVGLLGASRLPMDVVARRSLFRFGAIKDLDSHG